MCWGMLQQQYLQLSVFAKSVSAGEITNNGQKLIASQMTKTENRQILARAEKFDGNDRITP